MNKNEAEKSDIEQIKRDVHDIAIIVKVLAALIFIGLVTALGIALSH